MLTLCSLFSTPLEPGTDSGTSPKIVKNSQEPIVNEVQNYDTAREEAHFEDDSSDRLTASDFSYQGAFRLPGEFDWGGRGITTRPWYTFG